MTFQAKHASPASVEVETALVEAFVTDGNGVPRGKWVPGAKLAEVRAKGVLIPRSAYAQDIWGRDCDAAGLAHGTGGTFFQAIAVNCAGGPDGGVDASVK